jgi:hypothetical protein
MELEIANMLADYHKECDAADGLGDKGIIQLKHARKIMQALRIQDVHRFYQGIAKDHKVYADRILLAITDNGQSFQAYVTNEEETELRYLQDYAISNNPFK